MLKCNISFYTEGAEYEMMSRYGGILHSGMGMKRYYILSNMLMQIRCHSIMIKEKELELYAMITNDEYCFCGSTKSYQDCCPDINPQGVLAGLLKKYVMLDKEIERKRSENNVKFICHKGCDNCCSSYFYVSQIEYFAIKRYLEKNNADFKQLKEKARIVLDLLKCSHVAEYNKLKSLINDLDEIFDDEALSYFRQCIFLNKGCCSIYSVRPFICRLHGVSNKFVVCDKVYNKSKQMLSKRLDIDKLKNYTVDVPYREEYKNNVDYFILDNGRVNYIRPYPLFWWVVNDDLFHESYLLAKSLTVDEFTYRK